MHFSCPLGCGICRSTLQQMCYRREAGSRMRWERKLTQPPYVTMPWLRVAINKMPYHSLPLKESTQIFFNRNHCISNGAVSMDFHGTKRASLKHYQPGVDGSGTSPTQWNFKCWIFNLSRSDPVIKPTWIPVKISRFIMNSLTVCNSMMIFTEWAVSVLFPYYSVRPISLLCLCD